MADAAACYVTPSSVIPRGTAFDIVSRFWSIDALEGTSELTDPDEVTVTVLAPDGTETVYSGSELANPAYGVFVLSLGPQLPTGIYHVSCKGTGAVDAESADETFTISPNAVDTPDPPPRPVIGPCTQWISGQDVANCTRVDYGNQPVVFDAAAYNASLALYEISGRRFPGICERKVRPCRQDCGCGFGGPISSGFGPWYWSSTGSGWGWCNESGDRCGCSPMSKVKLAGYPVVEIVQVLIDGAALPEFDAGTGARNWRLDKWRYLVRMDDPGPPVQPQRWPGCQNLSLDDDQPGTFAVTYKWGSDVPQLGRDAAVELANQLWLACGGAGNCILPLGATRVVRQGIEVDRSLLAQWMDPKKPTGLINLDTFLAAYTGGQRSGRRSALWSPDVQAFARRVGINE